MPVFALLTDFGQADDYVGLMHARLLDMSPDARVVDLCHNVQPGAIEQAAFLLLYDRKYFPPGTVFVAVVDPGVGTERGILAARLKSRQSTTRDTFLISPDNGLLDPLLDLELPENSDISAVEVFKVDVLHFIETTGSDPDSISSTFHGRDLFAPLGAWVANGGDIAGIAQLLEDWQRLNWRPAQVVQGRATGRVMHIDRFGNLVTDIVPGKAHGRVLLAGTVLEPVRTFSDLEPGNPGWLIGSKGTIEIVVNGDSAANLPGAEFGAPVLFESVDR